MARCSGRGTQHAAQAPRDEPRRAGDHRDRSDVPYPVILHAAIEIAKRVRSEHGHTYVNGVLDQAAGQWRAAEINARR